MARAQVTAAGDGVAQLALEDGQWSSARNLRFAFLGAALVGPTLHVSLIVVWCGVGAATRLL